MILESLGVLFCISLAQARIVWFVFLRFRFIGRNGSPKANRLSEQKRVVLEWRHIEPQSRIRNVRWNQQHTKNTLCLVVVVVLALFCTVSPRCRGHAISLAQPFVVYRNSLRFTISTYRHEIYKCIYFKIKVCTVWLCASIYATIEATIFVQIYGYFTRSKIHIRR